MNLVLPHEEPAEKIGLKQALEKDILPWLIAGGFVLAFYLLIVAAIAGVAPQGKNSFELASGALYQQLGVAPFFVLVASFAARRKKDTWMWTTALLLVLFVMPQHGASWATTLLPNTILSSVVALAGLLAIGRIVEHIYKRRLFSDDEKELTIPAWLAYIATIIVSGYMTIPLVYTLTGA